MNQKIQEIAQRVKAMREILGISVEDMCVNVHLSKEDYIEYESGSRDFPFSLLYEIAQKLGIDITELISGEMPKLSRYSIIRSGQGLPIARREGFSYQHLAYLFRNRESEPLRVIAPYNADAENLPIKMSSHAGQEFNYIISGTLKFQIDDHIMVLNPGDAVYYDAQMNHGMISTGGEDCVFLAIIINTSDSTRG